MSKTNDPKLRKVRRFLGLKSAGWLRRGADTWEIFSQSGWTKKQQSALSEWLNQPQGNDWLVGSLTNGRMRSRPTKDSDNFLAGGYIYVFPNKESQTILIIEADELSKEKKNFLKIIAEYGNQEIAEENVEFDLNVLFQPLEFGIEPTYDLQGVLQQVLDTLFAAAEAEHAYIALRFGNTFVLKAQTENFEDSLGLEVNIDTSQHLTNLVTQRIGLLGNDLPEEGLVLFMPDRSQINAAWMLVPFVVGQRVIGYAAFWRSTEKPYGDLDLNRVSLIAERTANFVENAIVFSETARYLQQLALVNELASAASSGSDIQEVSQRLLSRLKRVFSGVNVSLYLLSADGNWLQELGTAEAGRSKRVSVNNSLPGYVVQTERPMSSRTKSELPPNYAIPTDINSILLVPLRYRGKVIGLLDLTSQQPDAFSSEDEQLLVMIASHLAGLIENVRLNDETRRRARNLSLIHQVVQRIVGLTDPAEICQVAASLMADQFDYDYVGVMLINDSRSELILSGVSSRVPIHADFRINYPLDVGLMGEVLADGKSRVVDRLSYQDHSHPVTGAKSGSEMCVMLYSGDLQLGLIDALRDRSRGFSKNDLLTLEALAGVLSSVLTNAHRYQQLQTSVRQLEAARETGLEIAGDLDLDILLRRVVRRARELIGARGAELALVDDRAEIVRIVVSENPWRDFTGTEVPFMSGVEGKVAVLGEPVVVGDYNQWSGRLYPERHMPYHAVAGIPLKLQGKVIGVLLVSDDRPERTFRPEDLQLLEFFAAQAAVFIRNARLYQEIQDRMEAQRQAEMQLVRSARLAAVGEMAAGVAHELNNPLTTVAGFIELVLDELPEESSHRNDLELVLRESRRARGVVRRLLDFSRPSDNLRIRTDINELVSEVLTLVQHLVRTNGVELHFQFEDELTWIRVDPNQIKQVLLNLVHNALQAMPRGGTLAVQTANVVRDQLNWVIVAVRDSGTGIKPEFLERIFEPFFTTRPVGSGTGLGLSVSYGIIMEHGGFIEVESVPDEGSCFTVWLPVDENGG